MIVWYLWTLELFIHFPKGFATNLQSFAQLVTFIGKLEHEIGDSAFSVAKAVISVDGNQKSHGQPPGMVLKPTVNHGIKTYQPPLVSLPEFWLPSTVSEVFWNLSSYDTFKKKAGPWRSLKIFLRFRFPSNKINGIVGFYFSKFCGLDVCCVCFAWCLQEFYMTLSIFALWFGSWVATPFSWHHFITSHNNQDDYEHQSVTKLRTKSWLWSPPPQQQPDVFPPTVWG